jgi:hypothetical protein
LQRVLAVFYVFVFALVAVAHAKNPDFVRKLQRESVAAKSIDHAKTIAAKNRLAHRLQNQKKLESQKVAESQMNSSLIKAELNELLNSKPTEENLTKAIKLRNQLRFYSQALEEFIIQCYWYTGYQKEAEDAARLFLQNHESPIIHKVLLESSIQKKTAKLALFHLERAKLEFLDSTSYRLKILSIQFSQNFSGPVVFIFLSIFILVFLWMFFKIIKRAVLFITFSLTEKIKSKNDSRSNDDANTNIKNYAQLKTDEESKKEE